MASFDQLIDAYRRHLQLPWATNLSDAERTWVLWYDPSLERRVAGYSIEFEQAARKAGYGWKQVDLAAIIANWLANNRHAERLMRRPNEVITLKSELMATVTQAIESEAAEIGNRDILALIGAGSLFGFASVASLMEAVAPKVKGRLLVAFPGRYETGRYRLLDARDSWNYHATPIPSTSYQ
jgi:hypothetical protein